MENQVILSADNQPSEKSVIIYRSKDGTIQLEVQLVDDTVWLTQHQMTVLFETTKQNVSLHINNAFKEGELEKKSVVKDFLTTASDGKRYHVLYYNLDAIISIGYRVKSHIIKNHILHGYAVNQRFEQLEQRVAKTEEKIDFFVKASLPPIEGIFYDGQIFDAYSFISDLFRMAKKEIILIDNYIDDTVLKILNKREDGVSATIYTSHISENLKLDLDKHNSQYQPIYIECFNKSHDRFLIIDDDVYLIGGSIKDLGKKVSTFIKLSIQKEEFLQKIF